MGTVASFISESWPPASKFNTSDIPDLTGKVVIVTGGNTGIGYETVKALLSKDAKVYLAARSKEKARAAIERLQTETGKTAVFLPIDLASKASIRESAAEFKAQETALHILFNNAGVMSPPLEQLTADGYDLTFGTNVLGHHILTMELMPLLIEGAKSSSDRKARVVSTASIATLLVSKIEWDTLKDGDARKKLGSDKIYVQSKFANAVYACELARRYGDRGIVSTSVNPGNISTELQRNLVGVRAKAVGMLLYPTPLGALTQLYAGTSPETANSNGKYFIPWAREGILNKAARDPNIGSELWKWCEDESK